MEQERNGADGTQADCSESVAMEVMHKPANCKMSKIKVLFCPTQDHCARGVLQQYCCRQLWIKVLSVQRVGLSPVQQPAEKSSGKLTRTEPRIAVLVRRAKQGGCAASGQNKMAVAAENNIAVAFI